MKMPLNANEISSQSNTSKPWHTCSCQICLFLCVVFTFSTKLQASARDIHIFQFLPVNLKLHVNSPVINNVRIQFAWRLTFSRRWLWRLNDKLPVQWRQHISLKRRYISTSTYGTVTENLIRVPKHSIHFTNTTSSFRNSQQKLFSASYIHF